MNFHSCECLYKDQVGLVRGFCPGAVQANSGGNHSCGGELTVCLLLRKCNESAEVLVGGKGSNKSSRVSQK